MPRWIWLYSPLWRWPHQARRMIKGAVNTGREAVVALSLQDANGQFFPVDVIIDTGYTGWLTLPPHLIRQLKLPFDRVSQALLADGTSITFSVYAGTVTWDGRPISIMADEVDSDPWLGMAQMQGYRLTVEDVAGGAVTIQRMRTRRRP